MAYRFKHATYLHIYIFTVFQKHKVSDMEGHGGNMEGHGGDMEGCRRGM